MRHDVLASVLILLAACARIPTPSDSSTSTPAPPLETKTSLATTTPPQTPTPTLTPTLTPSPTATVPPVVHFMAVGDVMLARSIGDRILAEGPAHPFAGVASVLGEADLLAANLECPISERGQPQTKAYTFRAPVASADSLALAGVDLVSLANNHALDYGNEALADTFRVLGERQIGAVGAGLTQTAARAPAIIVRKGLRAAFLAYVDVPVEGSTGFDTRSWIATADSPGVAWADVGHISADVAAARALADVVIVLLHSGLEGRIEVTAAQQAQAHAAVDAGAALVLGAHPHVLQRIEPYHGGLIVYSLGNFIFDGFGFPENYSAIFSATLTRAGVEEYGWIPVVIENGLPRLATPEESRPILDQVQPH